jgi:hypothetical protein
MTKTVVTRLLEQMITAQENHLYGEITVGRDSLRYSFGTHRVLDKLSTEFIHTQSVDEGTATYEELVVSTQGKRTSSHVFHVHELMDPRYYDFTATLHNPRLEIPPHFCALLEDAPKDLRPHLISIFGTQFMELAVPRDMETKELRDEHVVSRTRVLRCEPCVVFGGTVVLWG